MVDRGGLNYPIRVKDEFSATTKLFRQEIRSAKKEFREFQKATRGSKSAAANIRDQAKATKELVRLQKQLAKNSKKVSKPLTEEEAKLVKKLKEEEAQRKKIIQQIKEQKRIEREAVSIRSKQTADLKRQLAAVKAIAKEEERIAKQRERGIRAAALARQRASKTEERSRQREAKQRKRNEEIQRRKDPRIQAERKVAQELFRQQVALRQIVLLKKAAAAQRAGGDLFGSEQTLRRVKAMEKSLGRSAKSGNSLLFTFRRLVGTLAIFTLARKGVQTFQELVAQGIKFNDVIETSTLGIAGLVATLGDVRDAQGQSVSATEELNLALGIARQQTKKLRQDSLKTVATFEQLLDTFQVSVGPGLAAGLNLDEVRELTVDISQAAAALGVPQNQLAEEVRSLLSGTIQARTTRIATALGISNEDIRRLKEAGTLFEFLEERFAGFAEAAERQAKETFTGISVLIKGIVQEILGNAAQPLFRELLDLGRELFEEVLTVTDELDNIRPNPDIVSAFRSIFEALRDGVVVAREFGESFGVEGFQASLDAAGFAINVLVGGAEVLLGLFQGIVEVIQGITDQFGLARSESGEVARQVGSWGTRILLAQVAMKKLNKSTLTLVRSAAVIAAAFFAVAKAFEFILEKIFGVDLKIRDVISLISLGLIGAMSNVGALVAEVGLKITSSLVQAIDDVITAAKTKASQTKSFLAALFGSGNQEDDDRRFNEREAVQLAADNRRKKRANQLRLDLEGIERKRLSNLAGIQAEIDKVVGEAAEKEAKGPGFDTDFDPKAAAKAAAEAATSFVSTADKPINELGESLAKVNDEIRTARLEFKQAGAASGLGGPAGSISSAFDKEAIANAERLRKIRTELQQTEEQIVRLREASGVSAERELAIRDALLTNVEDRDEAVKALAISEGEGGLVSALRDQLQLQDGITNAQGESLRLATLKAATIAANALPALREEAALLQAQVAAERAVTATRVNDLGASQQALVAAQSSLDLAIAERDIARDKATFEAVSLQLRIQSVPDGKELDILRASLNELETKRGFEQEILDLKIAQLEVDLQQAELIANGTLTQGLLEGFQQFSEQFSSTFQAGINIAMQSIQALTAFASQAIFDALDPSKDSEELKQAYARILQQIAQIILQQLIQLAVAKALIKVGLGGGEDDIASASAVGAIRISTETTIAGIRLSNAIAIAAIKAATGFSEGGIVGAASGGLVPTRPGVPFAQGGEVPGHFGRRARGYARGGRPAHIPASDTIPAWLTPGEFVVNKGATSSFLPALEAMNGGKMAVVGSASAEGATGGMAGGGLVADQIAALPSSGGSEGGDVVLPVMAATEREMDTITAGGRNALLAWMREDAGNINTLLDRGAGRG